MLQVQNLIKTFNKDTVNEKQIFKNLSITVDEGDFITIIGSNGAGKSTLLNIISGAIPLDEGKIILKDKNISKQTEFKSARFIGRVFQNPTFGTSPSMTVRENLSLALNKGKSFNLTMCISKKNDKYFKELLSQLSIGLENHLDTKVGLLSGGQRQALTMLMATITKPELLLLDEPTAALDPKTSETIVELTERIVYDKNITTLMVTHDLNQAINVGNRLIMMHRGKIVLDIRGKEKKKLTIEKLLEYFKETQENDLISDRLLFS